MVYNHAIIDMDHKKNSNSGYNFSELICGITKNSKAECISPGQM